MKIAILHKTIVKKSIGLNYLFEFIMKNLKLIVMTRYHVSQSLSMRYRLYRDSLSIGEYKFV